MGKIYIGNKRECNKSMRCNNKNRERVGIIQIAKANLVDDPYKKKKKNTIQTEFNFFFVQIVVEYFLFCIGVLFILYLFAEFFLFFLLTLPVLEFVWFMGSWLGYNQCQPSLWLGLSLFRLGSHL